MYIEKARTVEIKRLEDEIQRFEKFKLMGPSFIEKAQKELEREPSRMEELQFKINYMSQLYNNCDNMIASLVEKLSKLLVE